MPLLGISWIFGLLSVNSGTIAFQYLFAIMNSSQVRSISNRYDTMIIVKNIDNISINRRNMYLRIPQKMHWVEIEFY